MFSERDSREKYPITCSVGEDMRQTGILTLLALAAVSCSRSDVTVRHVTTVDTDAVLSFARQAIVGYEQDRGALAELIQGGDTNATGYLETLGDLRDEWDTPIRFTVVSNGWEIRSAGPDRLFGTIDDRTRETTEQDEEDAR
jgi:hypothetical protein